MTNLIKLYGKRILKQKFIWLFCLVFLFVTYAYAFILSSIELNELLNVSVEKIGGIRFPEYMIRFYSSTIGPLFMAFITSIYINEEIRTGMFIQPLLHGKTKKDILNAKMIVLCSTSFGMVIMILIITYISSIIKWGTLVIASPVFFQTLIKYMAIAIILTVFEMGVILISLYSKNTMITMAFTLLIIILDGLINTTYPQIAKIFSFSYYSYNWVFDYQFLSIPVISIFKGMVLCGIYAIIFYKLVQRRILKMDFSS